jgi:hypothetical protein
VGRDGVIPVSMEVVILDVEFFQVCLWDFNALRIAPPIDVAGDPRPAASASLAAKNLKPFSSSVELTAS